MDKTRYFECSCSSMCHLLRLSVDDWDDDWEPEVYAEVTMNHEFNMFKRIWTAIKYVFGRSVSYGHYGCWVLKSDEATEMVDFLNEYIEVHDKWVRERVK